MLCGSKAQHLAIKKVCSPFKIQHKHKAVNGLSKTSVLKGNVSSRDPVLLSVGNPPEVKILLTRDLSSRDLSLSSDHLLIWDISIKEDK